jgi:predicted SAM-dependent methyltransferase
MLCSYEVVGAYQRLWSSSINPRGAWFCEIAAAMAMLYDGHSGAKDFPSPDGWQVECCEVGEWSSRYLHEAYPTITVHRADWIKWEPPYQYDAITGNHVLEHFEDAPAALAKMVATLAPGGKLYVELPAQLFDDGTSNEKAWPNGLRNHDHWWHFSEQTLRTWFKNLGLTKIGFANTIREYEDNKLMDYHVVAVKPA